MAAERILERLVARSEETDRALRQQSAQIVQLMEHLKSPPPLTFVPVPPDADRVRKEKIQNLGRVLMKKLIKFVSIKMIYII